MDNDDDQQCVEDAGSSVENASKIPNGNQSDEASR